MKQHQLKFSLKNLAYMKYALIILVDEKRSFLLYENILTYNRQVLMKII